MSRTNPLILPDSAWSDLAEVALGAIDQATVVRQNWDIAMFGLGGLSKEQFAVKHPGLNLDAVFNDPDRYAAIESLGVRHDLQNLAIQAQLPETTLSLLQAIKKKASDPDISATAARDLSDQIIKLSTLADRQKHVDPPSRDLSILLGSATVTTPENSCSFRIEAVEDCMRVVMLMRCSSEQEVDVVINALKESATCGWVGGGVTLAGW